MERGASFTAALESIHSEELKAHVDYLADDALEGREAGSRANREAGEYLANRFQEIGLIGAGVDGGCFQPFDPNFRNVLGLLPGADPELKQQYVVVGAHYDHLGYGTQRNGLGQVDQIHNGADDNASGTSALLELAEAFSLLVEPPKRSVLFALWDAEEKGLLGSKHWTEHPTLALDRVVVVLNLDMVGRLRDDRLSVYGSRTAHGWRRLLSENNEDPGLNLDFPWELKPNGDHWPFDGRGIPALMAHTGMHDEYHRPSDDAPLINVEGMRRVARFLFGMTYDLANRDATPNYREAARRERECTGPERTGENLPQPERLGIRWEEQQPPGLGILIAQVTAGSPADKAGLLSGDRVLELAGRPLKTGDDLTWAVAAAENPVSIRVQRPGREQPLELTCQFEGDPVQLGITWRVDDAEPGAVVLTRVVPGSPAARAGLKRGDYVYQIAGRDFADEAEFAQLAKTLPAPLKLLVERNGRLRTVEIRLEPEPLERAA
ncbi:MAG: M28 family peptidase [Planctomycetota bacterium]